MVMRHLIGVRIRRGRGARSEVERVEVGMSRSSKVTGSEGITGVVIEVEGEESREGDEERVIAVREVIVLDEETR